MRTLILIASLLAPSAALAAPRLGSIYFDEPPMSSSGGVFSGPLVLGSTSQVSTLGTLQLADPDGDSGLFWHSDDQLRLQLGGSSAYFFSAGTFTTAATMNLQGATLTLVGIDVDIDSTCVDGRLWIDTGGDKAEICYCQGANNPMCAILTAGPTD